MSQYTLWHHSLVPARQILPLSLSRYDRVTTIPLQYKTKTTTAQLTNIGIKFSRNAFGSQTQDSNKTLTLSKCFSSHSVQVLRHTGAGAAWWPNRSVNRSFSLWSRGTAGRLQHTTWTFFVSVLYMYRASCIGFYCNQQTHNQYHNSIYIYIYHNSFSVYCTLLHVSTHSCHHQTVYNQCHAKFTRF